MCPAVVQGIGFVVALSKVRRSSCPPEVHHRGPPSSKPRDSWLGRGDLGAGAAAAVASQKRRGISCLAIDIPRSSPASSPRASQHPSGLPRAAWPARSINATPAPAAADAAGGYDGSPRGTKTGRGGGTERRTAVAIRGWKPEGAQCNVIRENTHPWPCRFQVRRVLVEQRAQKRTAETSPPAANQTMSKPSWRSDQSRVNGGGASSWLSPLRPAAVGRLPVGGAELTGPRTGAGSHLAGELQAERNPDPASQIKPRSPAARPALPQASVGEEARARCCWLRRLLFRRVVPST